MRRFLRPSLRRPLPVFLTPTHDSVETVLEEPEIESLPSGRTVGTGARSMDRHAGPGSRSSELRILAIRAPPPQDASAELLHCSFTSSSPPRVAPGSQQRCKCKTRPPPLQWTDRAPPSTLDGSAIGALSWAGRARCLQEGLSIWRQSGSGRDTTLAANAAQAAPSPRAIRHPAARLCEPANSTTAPGNWSTRAVPAIELKTSKKSAK